MEPNTKKSFLSELENIDWDFAGERTSDDGLAFHWHPARFVPQIPSNLIGYFTEKGDTVLDPFCGSGTSLVEAFRLDRKPIGIDLSPTAIIITKARLAKINSDRFDSFNAKISSEITHRLLSKTDDILSLVPNIDENKKWYHASTLAELACIYSIILELDNNSQESTILKCCFSAILNKVCSQDRHFGWICDRVYPKTYKYINAAELFNTKLSQFKSYLIDFKESLKDTEPRTVSYDDIKIYQSDARDLSGIIDDHSVDLVITSPPYLNVTDYNKSFRLTSLWFGPDNWQEIAQSEIGARFKRSRKSSFDDYINDTSKYMTELYRVLRAGKYLCLVLGESSSHPAYIEKLLNLSQGLGFGKIHSIERRISIQRRLFPRLATEEVIILVKGR